MGKENNYPLVKYDHKKINEDVPIRDALAKYAGITVREETRNVKCPSPDHKDKNPSAHIYGNICKCFTCQKRFTPVDLAGIENPDLSFPALCRKVIEDFNLDIYEYSNLREVENIKNADRKKIFYDHFPVTDEDLKTIGLSGGKDKPEERISVTAYDLYMKECGFIPQNAVLKEKDGTDRLVELSFGEAASLGFIEHSGNEHEFTETPTLESLWREDKAGIEEMLTSKCCETMENAKKTAEILQSEADHYRESHSVDDIKEAELLRNAYIKARAKNADVALTPAQHDKITSLYRYEEVKDIMRDCDNHAKRAEAVLDKILSHQKQRKESVKHGWKRKEPVRE